MFVAKESYSMLWSVGRFRGISPILLRLVLKSNTLLKGKEVRGDRRNVRCGENILAANIYKGLEVAECSNQQNPIQPQHRRDREIG
jgi:hypothetical protein